VASWLFGPGVSYLGFLPAALGVALVVWSVRAMGRSLTPMPVPPEDSELVETGPYRALRHPIYVGGTLFFAGMSVALSTVGLALSAALAVLWFFKARREEQHLLGRFPEYADYRRRTLF
jgi:protein-S-isoprenylcysteine O-methyltransferase Ste14